MYSQKGLKYKTMYSVVYLRNYMFFTMVEKLHTDNFELALATYNNSWRAQFWYLGQLIMEK